MAASQCSTSTYNAVKGGGGGGGGGEGYSSILTAYLASKSEFLQCS